MNFKIDQAVDFYTKKGEEYHKHSGTVLKHYSSRMVIKEDGTGKKYRFHGTGRSWQHPYSTNQIYVYKSGEPFIKNDAKINPLEGGLIDYKITTSAGNNGIYQLSVDAHNDWGEPIAPPASRRRMLEQQRLEYEQLMAERRAEQALGQTTAIGGMLTFDQLQNAINLVANQGYRVNPQYIPFVPEDDGNNSNGR